MLLSKKVRDTQPNPRYSAKNNDAIRMIGSFQANTFHRKYTTISLFAKKNWKKTAKKRKYNIRFYPILDDFQHVFLQKNNFDFFLLKIHYYIDHKFPKFAQNKNLEFLETDFSEI